MFNVACDDEEVVIINCNIISVRMIATRFLFVSLGLFHPRDFETDAPIFIVVWRLLLSEIRRCSSLRLLMIVRDTHH